MRAAPFPSPGLPDDPSSLAARLRTVTAIARRHRRLLAALCAAAAVLLTVSALTPAAASSDHGDPRGRSLLPVGAGAASASDAERVAVIVRLADPAGLLLLRVGGHAEVVAGASADASAVPGATPDPDAEVLAPDALVLAVPDPPAVSGSPGASGSSGVSGVFGSPVGSTSGGLGGVVVLAVPPSDARRLAAAGDRSLSVAVALPPTPGG